MAKTTRLYTPDQVAEILQISISTVKRWLLVGELPGIKIGPGGHWRIRSDDLAAYVEGKRRRDGDKFISQSREAHKDE